MEGSHEITIGFEMVREIEEITYMTRQAVKKKGRHYALLRLLLRTVKFALPVMYTQHIVSAGTSENKL